jgi:hypothetical protein
MILSRCNYNKNRATEPWVCPADAKGFLQRDPNSSWATKYKTKETMRVNWFNASRGIEFSRLEVRHGCHYVTFVLQECYNNIVVFVANWKHEWQRGH